MPQPKREVSDTLGILGDVNFAVAGNVKKPKFEKIEKMQTLIIEIGPNGKVKELSSLLSSMDFIRKVSSVRKTKSLIAALQDDENLEASLVKRKNKAKAKYL